MTPEDVARALAEAESARTVALISLGGSLLTVLVSSVLAWITVRRGEQARLKSELRLRVHEHAVASVTEAVRAVSDLYLAVEGWMQMLVMGVEGDDLHAVEATARVQFRSANNAGLFVPPVLDVPLDTARTLIAEWTVVLEKLHSVPVAERAAICREAIVKPLAALNQLRSVATRWRRATWRELVGPEPVLEDDEPNEPMRPLDKEWLDSARNIVEKAITPRERSVTKTQR